MGNKALATQILKDGIEHEHDLQDFLRNIERLKDDIRKLKL